MQIEHSVKHGKKKVKRRFAIVMIIFTMFFVMPMLMMGALAPSNLTSKQTEVEACGATPANAVLPFIGKVQYTQGPFGNFSHQGIYAWDFASIGGANIPIIATASGTVSVPAFNAGGYGNYVILKTKSKTGEEIHLYYAHLDSVIVKDGSSVSPGIEIGKMGTTGYSTGVHLHFEAKNTSNVNIDGTAYVFGDKTHAVDEFIENTTTTSQGSGTPEKCTSSGSATNLEGNSNAEKAWNFFIDKGFTKEGAAGIIGNFMVESSLDPLAGEAGGSGGGRGIAQWGQCGTASNGASAGCRWKDLESWAAANGSQNPDELSTQLGFTYHEMEQRGMIDYFKTVTVVYTTDGGSYGGGAVGYFCEKFEAPAVQYAHMDKRNSYALDALAKFGG